MRFVMVLAVLTVGVACERQQPKTEPVKDHVWKEQVQTLDKARAAADKAGQAPERLREEPSESAN